MKPYTITGECNCEEDLRANWRRGNKNYRRKVSDRENKKVFRSRLKQQLRKDME